MNIRIATRKSALALWQAEHVAAMLRERPGVGSVELVAMSTRGDEILDKSLQKIGGKGLFIKELEVAMLEDRADIAVHSMKDVPVEMPDGFCLAAVLERANPFDALVSPSAASLGELPEGACIGSSSLRRQAQLLALRPDLTVRPLRGNVNTRLAKLEAGDYDAIILACAGLERLGFEARIAATLTPDEILPAAAQGVIGIECRADDERLREMLKPLEHPQTFRTTSAERAVAGRLEANCQSPIASFATLNGGAISLHGLVASSDGKRVLRESLAGDAADAERLGADLAERLLSLGAAELLAAESG